MENITVKQSVPIARVGDLLCSAWEGGSTYWCRVESKHQPEVITFGTMDGKPYAHEIALNEGGSVTLRDIEDDKIIAKRLTLSAVVDGLQVMAEKYPKHFADFLSENDDATTGDVFLQCCIFGEVIYG